MDSSGEFVCFYGHDEVVEVEAFDGMRPPGDGDFSPFDEHSWVVEFFFGEFAKAIGEGEGEFEVFELKYSLKLLDAVDVNDVPFGNLSLEAR